MLNSLSGLADALAAGRTTSRKLVEACLERIADPEGEGGRTFVKVHSEAALAAADAMDRLRAADAAPSRFAGIPISIKDLFDIRGDVTAAGSKVLLERGRIAASDAPAVARLRAAGFVVVGRTNMTEFAFSGLGINPHFGTPANPYDRQGRRIPGGSSSGAAVSVTDGMAAAGIGSDTGGSCRIPAALCGTVGYKPTASTVPCAGAVPLSMTLDSIGSMAATVGCCETLHRIMSGAPAEPADAADLTGLRIAVPRNIVLDGLDNDVACALERSLKRLSERGASILDVSFEWLSDIARINARGGFAAAEGYAWHRDLLADAADSYDPRVRVRLLRGREQDAADYIALVAARADFVRRATAAIEPYDLVAMPTVPMVAPPIGLLESDDETYTRINLAMLRNPTVVNMMDGCSVSLPMHAPGEAPTGLMLAAAGGEDRRLFARAKAVEAALGRA